MNPRSATPAIVAHVILAMLFAAVAIACAFALVAFVNGLIEAHDDVAIVLLIVGMAAVAAGVGGLAALALLRRIDILWHGPRLDLSPHGIAVRVYETGGRALLRPRFRWCDRTVAWPEFRGCRVEKFVAYELIPIRKSLVIESAGAPLEITWGAFRETVNVLERDILDYRRLQVTNQADEDARTPAFLKRLYARPVVYSGPRLGRAEVVGVILGIPVAGAAFCLHLREVELKLALALYGVLLAIGLAAGVLLLRKWIQASKFIRLGTDGIALGPEERAARLIAWSDLVLARAHSPAGSLPSSLTKLELRLRSGESVYIRAFPEAERWALLIDPPASAVRAAWRRIAAGTDVTTAARQCGIPVPE